LARVSVDTALWARVPPIDRLTANRPMVAMNQATITGQRWRALHIDTRTVHGLATGRLATFIG